MAEKSNHLICLVLICVPLFSANAVWLAVRTNSNRNKATLYLLKIPNALEDINGDGIRDVIAYFYHPYYCGSLGCSVEIYINKKGKLSPINFAFVLPEPKIGIIKSKSYGWYDLIVMDSNGNYRKLKWNGKEYK